MGANVCILANGFGPSFLKVKANKKVLNLPFNFFSLIIMKRFIEAVKNYFQDSYQELKKVTWPTRNQSIRLTLIVLGFCMVAAVIMGALDLAFNRGYLSIVNYAAKVVPPKAVETQTTPLSSEAPVVNLNPDSIKVETTPVKN